MAAAQAACVFPIYFRFVFHFRISWILFYLRGFLVFGLSGFTFVCVVSFPFAYCFLFCLGGFWFLLCLHRTKSQYFEKLSTFNISVILSAPFLLPYQQDNLIHFTLQKNQEAKMSKDKLVNIT